MTPTELRIFSDDIRRLLILDQISRYTMESLLMNKAVPVKVRNELNLRINGINRTLNVLPDYLPKSWDTLKVDYTHDRINDVALIMDLIIKVDDLERLNEVLNTLIVAA